MRRIAVAETESPIAVFRNEDGTLDARFAAPLLTRLKLEMRPPSLIGVYTRHSNQHEILAKLGYTTPPTGRKRGPKVKRGGYDIVDVPFTGAL
jgi:hypothetical protein